MQTGLAEFPIAGSSSAIRLAIIDSLGLVIQNEQPPQLWSMLLAQHDQTHALS